MAGLWNKQLGEISDQGQGNRSKGRAVHKTQGNVFKVIRDLVAVQETSIVDGFGNKVWNCKYQLLPERGQTTQKAGLDRSDAACESA